MEIFWACTQTTFRYTSTTCYELLLHWLAQAKISRSQRTTIVTTLQTDIKKTKEKFPNFQVNSLSCYQDLIKIRQIASDRKLWQKIVKSVVNTAEAEHQEGLTDWLTANPALLSLSLILIHRCSQCTRGLLLLLYGWRPYTEWEICGLFPRV